MCHNTLSFYTWHVLKQGIKQNLTIFVYWFHAFLGLIRVKMSTDKPDLNES